MFPGWWLALVGLPVFTQPLPEAPVLPAPIALVGGQVSLRSPCFRLVCRDAEWTGRRPRAVALAPPGTPARLKRQQVAAQRLRDKRLIALYAPSAARDRVIGYARNWRVDTTYRLDAIREEATSLQVELGTGYRIEPYTDFGTAVPGMVARGGFRLNQRFGEFAQWSQRVLFETGRENTYVRQTIGLDLFLLDHWTLTSNLETWHDTAGNGGEGHTEHHSSFDLRYTRHF